MIESRSWLLDKTEKQCVAKLYNKRLQLGSSLLLYAFLFSQGHYSLFCNFISSYHLVSLRCILGPLHAKAAELHWHMWCAGRCMQRQARLSILLSLPCHPVRWLYCSNVKMARVTAWSLGCAQRYTLPVAIASISASSVQIPSVSGSLQEQRRPRLTVQKHSMLCALWTCGKERTQWHIFLGKAKATS
jgi:hypothetical protein